MYDWRNQLISNQLDQKSGCEYFHQLLHANDADIEFNKLKQSTRKSCYVSYWPFYFMLFLGIIFFVIFYILYRHLILIWKYVIAGLQQKHKVLSKSLQTSIVYMLLLSSILLSWIFSFLFFFGIRSANIIFDITNKVSISIIKRYNVYVKKGREIPRQRLIRSTYFSSLRIRL